MKTDHEEKGLRMNGEFLTFVGVWLIISTAVFAFWMNWRQSLGFGTGGICLIGAFAGAFLILNQRVTEFSILGLGKIKAAVEDAESNAKKIEQLRTEVEAGQKQTALINEFSLTVIKAQADDRIAFDKLEDWALDEKFPLRMEAEKTWLMIIEAHNSALRSMPGPFETNDPTKFSLEDIAKVYNTKDTPFFVRQALLQFIRDRNDIPKRQRMEFYISVMRTETSLKALEDATLHFNEMANLHVKRLLVKPLYEWWESNKNNIK